MNNLPYFNQLVHGFNTWAIPNPGAGNSLVWQVPQPYIISPTCLSFVVRASAVAALRVLTVDISTGGEIPFRLTHTGFVAAGTIRTVCIGTAFPIHEPTASPGCWLYPFPVEFFISEGNTIFIALNPMDAADTLTDIYLQARYWLAT